MNSEEQQFLNDLGKKLWTAANKLLPMLDAAVYKHVVHMWHSSRVEKRCVRHASMNLVRSSTCDLVHGIGITSCRSA